MVLPHDSDNKLISSCLAGNRRHCRKLVERYQNYVAGLVWKLVGEAELTRDLTQEVFCKAFNGMKGFRQDSSFKTWLVRIAENICRDHHRRLEQRLRPAHSSLDAGEDGKTLDLPDNNPGRDPLRELQRKEAREVVDEALAKLSFEHKTVILLKEEGYSYAEIAAITGVSTGTVASRISQARERLRQLLAPYFKGKKT